MPSARADPLLRSVAAGAAAVVLLGGCSGDYVAEPSPATSAATDADAAEAAAVETVAGLQRALRAGDPSSAADLAADDRVAAQLAAAAGNAESLQLSDLSLRFLTATPGAAGDWSVDTELTWRFAGYDREPARREVSVVLSADGTEVVGLGGSGADALPTWLQAPMEARRSGDALVVAAATGDGGELRRLARRADAGLRQIRTVLGERTRAVIEVPASDDGLDRALDAAPGTYAGVAAVTAPVDGSPTDDAPVHVFLNPGVYGDLDEVAAQVVVTHELVHAVTRAPQVSGVPLWFVEGFADYVALRDVDLPVERTAGQIIDKVAADGPPAALPTDAEMNLTAQHLGAQYEAAWLACVVLAEHAGEAALVDLYRDVVSGTELSRALARRTDWQVDDLTTAWRERLTSLAGGS